MSEKPAVPLNCLFQAYYNPLYEAEIKKCKDLCWAYNQLNPNNTQALQAILSRLLGKMGKNPVFMPPFWCDYGYHISVGDDFYGNHGLVIQDGANVSFGDHVFIGPNCCFTTAEHPIDPEQRRQGLEIAKPITVGSNVWIGAGCTVLAGVTIGDNAVIGAGSVVTGSIPAGVVAVGVPCRVLREINQADKYRYPIFDPRTGAL